MHFKPDDRFEIHEGDFPLKDCRGVMPLPQNGMLHVVRAERRLQKQLPQITG
jgi:hypothetical protein